MRRWGSRDADAGLTQALRAPCHQLVCLVLRFGWAWESVTNWTWVCFATTLLFLYISYNSILHGTEEGTDHECVARAAPGPRAPASRVA